LPVLLPYKASVAVKLARCLKTSGVRFRMAHKYKLTYFNFHGRGECARMLFALAGVEYEDHRIEWAGDAWKEFKPKTPFGQLPLLEVDGKVFCQSVAIARYLGNKFGFTGKTDLDKLQADMIVDCIVDLCNQLGAIGEERDETKKQELWKAFEPKLDKHLENLEMMLAANNGGNGFFVGDSITGWTASGLVFSTGCTTRSVDQPLKSIPKWQPLRVEWSLNLVSLNGSASVHTQNSNWDSIPDSIFN